MRRHVGGEDAYSRVFNYITGGRDIYNVSMLKKNVDPLKPNQSQVRVHPLPDLTPFYSTHMYTPPMTQDMGAPHSLLFPVLKILR